MQKLIAAALLLACAPVMAWNNQGHMATGAIAYDTLTRTDPAAVAAIVAIMRAHPDRARFDRVLGPLTGPARDRRLFELMARWPDDIRKTAYDRPEWHYDAKVVSGWTWMPLRFGKATEQFNSQLTMVRDASAPAAARAMALCWVFHITGDMHEPLHAGHRLSWTFPLTDRLGTIGWVRTRAGGAPVSFHEFWDSAADGAGPELAAAEDLALRSARAVGAGPVATGTAAARFNGWVAQSQNLAASAAYRGAALDESNAAATAPVLPAAYQQAALSLAEHRIGQGGGAIAGVVAGLKPPRAG
jgi:hypothetical protein